MNTSERAIIGALIDGDAEGWKAAMTSLESGRASRVMMTTFANACFRKFPESVSDDDIATYVRELRERHLPGADLGIVPTKMAIRGVLGKPGALNGISATDLLTAQIVITNDVAQEYSLSAAIFRKWSEDPSLQTVVDYVAEIDRRFPAELPVARTVLEAVIRGVFGKTDLVDGISGQDLIVAEILITRCIGFDVLASAVQRNSYFDEVLAALD